MRNALADLERAVRGAVYTIDQEPIAGARVQLGEGDAARTTTTATDGEFRFDGVGPGRHALRVAADPFTPFEGEVAAGDWIDVELWHGPVLDLRVITSSAPAPPLRTVRVGLARNPEQGWDGWPAELPTDHAIAEMDTWRLIVSLHHWLRREGLPVEPLATVPPAPLPAFRVYVVLADGRYAASDAVAPDAGTRRIEVTIAVAGAPVLRGRLLDLDGRPLGSRTVSAQPDEGVVDTGGWLAGEDADRDTEIRTDREGRFALPLSGPGPFRLRVGGERDGRLVGPSIPGGAAAPRTEQEFRMEDSWQSVRVRGVLRDARGEPAGDAVVTFAPPDADPRVVDGGTWQDGVRQPPEHGAITAADGTFEVRRPLRVGSYLVTVEARGHGFEPFGPVRLRGDDPTPLELRLPVNLHEGTLHGRVVRAGEPLRAALTVVALSGAHGALVAETDPDGRFSIELPDRFPMALFVTPRAGGGPCHAERVDRHALAGERQIEVAEPATDVRVMAPDGQPVDRCALTIAMTHDREGRPVPAPGPEWQIGVEDGGAQQPIPRGQWFVLAQTLEWSPRMLGWAEVDTRAGSAVTIALHPARALAVRLTDGAGSPVAGALVELIPGLPMRALGAFKLRTGPDGVARMAPCFGMGYGVRVRAPSGAVAEDALPASWIHDPGARLDVRVP